MFGNSKGYVSYSFGTRDDYFTSTIATLRIYLIYAFWSKFVNLLTKLSIINESMIEKLTWLNIALENSS
jgi:hypothetical protein